jgi:hypothetical protein
LDELRAPSAHDMDLAGRLQALALQDTEKGKHQEAYEATGLEIDEATNSRVDFLTFCRENHYDLNNPKQKAAARAQYKKEYGNLERRVGRERYPANRADVEKGIAGFVLPIVRPSLYALVRDLGYNPNKPTTLRSVEARIKYLNDVRLRYHDAWTVKGGDEPLPFFELGFVASYTKHEDGRVVVLLNQDFARPVEGWSVRRALPMCTTSEAAHALDGLWLAWEGELRSEDGYRLKKQTLEDKIGLVYESRHETFEKALDRVVGQVNRYRGKDKDRGALGSWEMVGKEKDVVVFRELKRRRPKTVGKNKGPTGSRDRPYRVTGPN